MSETVELPALGESVTEGTVTRWLKSVGDTVEVDEPLVEVSTDKVDTEIPSPVAGVIEEILVEEDEEVEVGAPLVRIGDGSGASGDSSGSDEQEEAPAEEAPAAEESAEEPAEAPAQDDSAQQGSGSAEGSEVTLPALGESVTEGTVTRWLKAVGDSVEVDEPLVEVSTDKVDTEIPSPVAGTLLEIKVDEDEEAEVGQVLAIVGAEGASSAPSSPEPEQKQAEPEQKSEEKPAEQPKAQESAPEPEPEQKKDAEDASPQAAQPTSTENAGSAGSAESYVTPLVRKLAKQENIDLSTVKGTGVGGRIRKQDVQAAVEAKKSEASAPAAEQAAPAPAEKKQAPAVKADTEKRGKTEKAPRIRQTIANRMKESLEVSAQLTQVAEVDMTRVAKLRGKAKDAFASREGAKLTFLPFFAKAVAEALQQHPKLNASYDADSKEITYHASEDIAIAVDTERGLLVPVISDAGDLNLAGLAKKIADVGERTKSGKIGPDELSGGTFTITNIGSFGALFDTPIINQPQVAILGTGSIVKRPVVITDSEGNDTIAIRHMCYLSLTYDHRLVDGADAGRFLSSLKKRLEDGAFESEVGL